MSSDDDLAIHIDARAETLCTGIFAIEAAAVFYLLLSQAGHVACPLGPAHASAALVAACIGTFFVVQLVKRSSSFVGVKLSKAHVFPGHPLRKAKARRKFTDRASSGS